MEKRIKCCILYNKNRKEALPSRSGINRFSAEGKVKSKHKDLLNSIADSLIWLFTSLVFGLMQCWLLMGWGLITETGISVLKFLIDGVLLFFCRGIVIGCCFDMWHEPKISKNTRLFFISHFLFPFVLIIAIVCNYFSIFQSHGNVAPSVILFQVIILFFSLLYTTTTKIYLYKLNKTFFGESGK
jgi:hypothetical protein